jgi:glycosyltransferase involved in cell wall biosynthesis
MEDLSVVTMARNEEEAMPDFIASLSGISDIVIIDNGSTDNTIKIAESLGARVFDGTNLLKLRPSEKDIESFREMFGYDPLFTTETIIGSGSESRNYGASLAVNDWCFFPDCDERVTWDLGAIKNILPEFDRLRYQFCHSHNPDGSCSLEFSHSKFARKSRTHWEKRIHEVIVDSYPDNRIGHTDLMRLDHWQAIREHRLGYHPQMEYEILETPDSDRVAYYLAREYYYYNMHEKAIKMFERYLNLGGWPPERSQACIFMGESFNVLNQPEQAIKCFHKAMIEDDKRREQFWTLGKMYYDTGKYQSAIIYFEAALSIPYNKDYFLNDITLYTWAIEDHLSLCYHFTGNNEKAREHWIKALAAAPDDARILANGPWFCGKVNA